MSPLSTKDVAGLVGINPATLERWLSSGRLKSPKKLVIGRKEFRHWTARDIERVRKFKAKNYMKGRGRKPKKKS